MKSLLFLLLIFFNSFQVSAHDWTEVRNIVNSAIEQQTLPGGVLIVGNRETLLFYEAFGTVDTITPVKKDETLYDIASLTKIVATTTSIMLLEERGVLSLENKISDYFPLFTGNGKENVTIEQVMRHESGLAPWMAPKNNETFESYFERILKANLSAQPGTKFAYSDLGFILLAQIVQKISGKTIADFAHENIFSPLEMNSTFYHVPDSLNKDCAPTLKTRQACLPNDPLAYQFSSVELGHAGLFTTAENLSHLVSMYLNMGKYKENNFLKEETVKKMISLPSGKMRGLGFDLTSPYSTAPRGGIFPVGLSFGHTGYTGTTIWIDPASGTYYIFLSNRVFLGDELTSSKFSTLRFDLSTAIGKQIYGTDKRFD